MVLHTISLGLANRLIHAGSSLHPRNGSPLGGSRAVDHATNTTQAGAAKGQVREWGSQIGKYIEAWKSNFEEFKQLRSSITGSGQYMKTGKMQIEIRVNGGILGSEVCLRSDHCCVKNEQQLCQYHF